MWQQLRFSVANLIKLKYDFSKLITQMYKIFKESSEHIQNMKFYNEDRKFNQP